MLNRRLLNRLHVKVHAAPEPAIDPRRAVPVFLRWIEQSALDEALIDVHDYGHVPRGAGVLLVGHEANVSLDFKNGEPGLLYARKQDVDHDDVATLRLIVGRALDIAAKLAAEPEMAGLTFPGEHLDLTVNDRLIAPNEPATLERFQPLFQSILDPLFGAGAYTLSRDEDPRQRFGVRARAAVPTDLPTLLSRLP